jgi:hypothetical protein
MKGIRLALFAMAVVGVCAAAESISAGPVLSGYLYDANARSLRAVLGVPGSAYLSSAVVDELDAAWPSPDRNHAIGVRGERTLLFTSLKSLHASEVAGIQLILHPTRVSWSVRGRAAVLYSATHAIMQVVRVSEDSITAETPISARSVGGEISALAITDSGFVSLAGGDAVYVADQGGLAQRWIAPGITALAFCGGERLCAAAADALLELGTGGEVQRKSGADAVSGIACTGTRVITVDPRTPAIVIHESDGTRVEIPLDRQPSAIQPIQSDSVFLLNGVEDGRRPAVVLDVSSSPGVFFVPAGDAGTL